MKVNITKDVFSHHTNPEFNVVIVHFEPQDQNYFPDRHNWIPRWYQLEEIIKAFIKCEPEYAQELIGIIKDSLANKQKRLDNLGEN